MPWSGHAGGIGGATGFVWPVFRGRVRSTASPCGEAGPAWGGIPGGEGETKVLGMKCERGKERGGFFFRTIWSPKLSVPKNLHAGKSASGVGTRLWEIAL